MRIFVAGATGVVGRPLVQELVAAGHQVAGMTRSASKTEMLRGLGAEPIVCDVYDADALRDAVVAFRPDVVVHELTDLPDDASQLAAGAGANARIRREGTRNLLAAATAAGATRFVAQSVAWRLDGDGGAAVREHEQAVLAAGGVVVRYGRFYGPGTYHETDQPDVPRVHVEEAARRTVPLLDAPSGVIVIADQ
jgi:nucleoside-diphosphate-sugar epimerase